jgi:hypothetical protein
MVWTIGTERMEQRSLVGRLKAGWQAARRLEVEKIGWTITQREGVEHPRLTSEGVQHHKVVFMLS